MTSNYRTAKTRRAMSLIEVMGAMICATIAIIPTAQALSQANIWTTRIEMKNELRLLCESKLDELDFQTASSFIVGSSSGNFANLGRSDCIYSYTITDTAASAIKNFLMTTTISSFHDANGNRLQDAGEASYQSYSQIAKRR